MLLFLGLTPCLWVVISKRFKTTTLSGNIRDQLSSDVASYPRQIGVSVMLLWKPKNSVSFYFVLWFSRWCNTMGFFMLCPFLTQEPLDQFSHHSSAMAFWSHFISALEYIIHKLKILRQLQSKHTRISTLCIHYITFSGVFASSWMCVLAVSCLSFRMYQHGSCQTYFHWNFMLGLCVKICPETPNGIKIGQFMWQLQYILLLPAVLNLLIGTVFRWNGIKLLGWPRRYKHVNMPQCCVIHTFPILFCTYSCSRVWSDIH